MAVPFRPIATTGVALAAAGVIAVAPSAPPALLAAPPAPATPAVALTSAVNPLVAWVDLFNTTQVNWAAIVDEWNQAPAPVLQQMLVNWVGYFEELPNLGEIIDQIGANFHAATEAIVAYNENAIGAHALIYEVLAPEVPADLLPLIDYTTTYSSGIMLGILGTFLSPWLAFSDSIHDIIDYTFGEDPDLGKALNTFLNIPADWLNGFFNGYGNINLAFLADILPLPPGTEVTKLDLVMGGLFSPAGTAFSAIDIGVTLGGFPITIPGVKAGPIASWIAQGKVQAEALGWSGEGNPLAELLPTEEAEEAAPEEEAPEEEALEEEAPEEEALEEEALEEEAPEEEAPEEEAPEEEAPEEELAEEEATDEEFIELALAEEESTEEAGAEAGAEDDSDEPSTDPEDSDSDTDSEESDDSESDDTDAA